MRVVKGTLTNVVLIAIAGGTLTTTDAFAAGRMCRSAFSVVNAKDRAKHSDLLREFPDLSVAEVQSSIDLGRRMIQSLFIDTKLFVGPQKQGVSEFTPELIKARLEGITKSFSSGCGLASSGSVLEDLRAIRANGKTMDRVQLQTKLSEGKAVELVETLIDIQKDPASAAAELSQIVAPKDDQTNQAIEKSQWRAENLKEVADSVAERRNEFDMKGAVTLPIAFGSVPATWALQYGLSHFGLSLPFVNNIGLPSDFLLAVVGYPVGGFFGSFVGVDAFNRAPLLKAKAALQRFRTGRLRKKVIKGAIADVPPVKTVTFERTDSAFEATWDRWRTETLQAERAPKTADTEVVMNRLAELSLIAGTLEIVEMPNGESFGALAPLATVLTPERIASINEGYGRKIKQIDLLLREADWIQYDIEALARKFKEQQSLPSYATAEWIETNKNFVQMTESALDKTEGLLLANRMRFELTKDRFDAGEKSTKTFLKHFAKK